MSELFWAPAKLTVSLRVVGRRTDGYHLLESEMVTVDLADRLRFEEGPTSLSMHAARRARAEAISLGGDNLVLRALALLGREARIELDKQIPVGGGLGGGSADAGAVLRWGGGVSYRAAATLGADVPFCMVGGRAMVGGIGEEVSPLAFESRAFTLLVPPIFVDTASVYRAHDGLVDGSDPTARDEVNDLTAAAIAVEPRLARWRDRFAAASEQRPRLAGSGSTWWIDGHPPSLAGIDSLEMEGVHAPLIAVRTVPAGWVGSDVSARGNGLA